MTHRLIAALSAFLALAACSRPPAGGALNGAGAIPDDPASRQKVVAYLVAHPGVIQEGINAYNDKQHKDLVKTAAAAIAPRRALIEADGRDFVANPQGKITVVEFFDYRCPYCKADLPALQALIAQEKDIRFIFKEYPIIPDKDGKIGVSLRAAQAALAAKRAGKYLEVHNALMAAADLDDETIHRVLVQNGVDPALAAVDAKDLDQITDVRKLAQEIHVAGTPTFIVGDTLVDTSSMDQLAAAIAQARQAAKS